MPAATRVSPLHGARAPALCLGRLLVFAEGEILLAGRLASPRLGLVLREQETGGGPGCGLAVCAQNCFTWTQKAASLSSLQWHGWPCQGPGAGSRGGPQCPPFPLPALAVQHCKQSAQAWCASQYVIHKKLSFLLWFCYLVL